MGSLLQATCLKPSYSLRRQLLLSFGTSAFVTISLVVTLACISAHIAGEIVKFKADGVVIDQEIHNLLDASRFIADRFSGYMADMDGSIQLIVEMTQDRIAGYSNGDGWSDDRHVPFFDMDTKANRYPLRSPRIPMDWNITANVNSANGAEHVQERTSMLLARFSEVSTASAAYFMQGSCDPQARRGSPGYLENCTAANNDFSTGGVDRPTVVNKWLHEKASDLGVLLKPLYEAQPDAIVLGIYFVNMGAGAVVHFPGFIRNRHGDTYESKGCDWMRKINPHTKRPFGGEDEIARCRPAGTVVKQHLYNPNERSWFHDCALHPEEVRWFGPYASAPDGIQSISVSRSIFDRRTGELIGCALIDVQAGTLNAQLDGARLHKESELAIARFENGAMVAGSHNLRTALVPVPTHVTDTRIIDPSQLDALQNVVDFRKPWTPEQVEEAFSNSFIRSSRGMHSVYPLPSPPDEYDPAYRPTMLLVHTVPKAVFDAVYVDDSINGEVYSLVLFSIATGVFGMLVVLAILYFVSRMLTQPLLWMESLARQIVRSAVDETAGEGDLIHLPDDDGFSVGANAKWCAPSTELSELVTEFCTMIKGFSGEGASKVAESNLHEIRVMLTWQSDFHHLYSTSPSSSAESDVTSQEATKEESADPSSSDLFDGPIPRDAQITHEQKVVQKAVHRMTKNSVTASIVPAPPKKNTEPNVRPLTAEGKKMGLPDNGHRTRTYQSSLFRWIVVLIVVPVLLTNIVICIIATHNILVVIPSLVRIAERSSIDLEMDSLKSTAAMKASLAETTVFEPVRDLHLLTRVAGWLLFGGISRSSSFTELNSGTEECKRYPSDDSCPFYDSLVCPCSWEDVQGITACTETNKTESRRLQRRSWALQARDADPVTGARREASSFPEYDHSANTTLWWATVEELPGSHKGAAASGYETSYDRSRVSSAMSLVEMPVYNYITSLGRTKFDLGTYLGFEADGLFCGYPGCDNLYPVYSHFKSEVSNRASEIAPDLCPLGKYGYDPRCRAWYADGKSKYLKAAQSVHITAPYKFAVDGEIAASATSPVANPRTKEYIGQMLLDFWPEGIHRSLERLKQLSILITPEKDSTGGDTVVGPNKTEGWKSASVVDLLFTDDDPHRDYFERNVLALMKNGSEDWVRFSRTKDDGTEETFRMAFSPVYARALLPLSPDDFSRGATASTTLVYSVGVAVDESSMTQPFHMVEDTVTQDLERIDIIYISLVAVISVLVTVATCKITFYVTKPMITLLHVVQSINSGILEDDFPPLKGGSSEVKQVYNSFTKLYKLVRISNTAFFSGNLKWAYHFVTDALQVFRLVDDRKAIGIACNNLGNILYAMHYGKRDIGDFICGSNNGVCVTKVALKHYNESIRIGQLEFDEASEEELKADYAQQLADRMFNRGLFLLLSQDDACAPADARERAFSDLARARELDGDIQDFWLERKLLLKNSASCFCRLLRRIHGLIDVYDDEIREVWDAKELVAEADHLLFAAWNEHSAPLFHSVTPVGRLQQLQAAVIRLELLLGNTMEAACFAMRVFTEDEYILEGTFKSAADALLRLVREDQPASWSSTTSTLMRRDLRKMVNACKNVALNMGKCFVLALELSERWHDDPVLEKAHSNCLKLYDDSCFEHDYVGLVGYTTRGDLSVELDMKGDNEGRQRSMIDIATSSISERVRPAFPVAVQMVVDAAPSLENDSYLLVLTDGQCWNSDYSSIKCQLERWNRERLTTIHVIIVGLDLVDSDIIDQCKTMCTVSKASFYVAATAGSIDAAFEAITTVIAGRSSACERIQGITMEKF